MIKRLTALLLSISLIFLISCGEKDLLIDEIPSDPPPKDDTPAPDSPPSEQEESEEPEEPVDNTADVYYINEYTERFDTSFLAENKMSIEMIFPVSDEILFVFVSRTVGDRISEQQELWPYSVKKGEFTGDHLPIGLIGQYPDKIFDDGTVLVSTLNSETYEYKSLLFIDIYTLECREQDISHIENLRSIDFSGSKEYAALSTQEGLFITEPDLDTVVSEYRGYVLEGGDPDLDYHLPFASGWMPDGSAVIGKLLGWEWVYHPFILYPDGSLTVLDEQSELIALPFGNSLAYIDYFTGHPKGFSKSDGTDFTSDSLGLSLRHDGTGYVSATAFDPKGSLIAVAETVMTDDSSDCHISFFSGGKSVRTLELNGSVNEWASVDRICFMPNGKSALLLSCATPNTPRQIYRVSLK